MKTQKNITFGIAALALVAILSASVFTKSHVQQDSAEGRMTVYERAADRLIGITPANTAVGQTYSISTGSGMQLVNGIITSVNTIYIPTEKLEAGIYTFRIGKSILEKFCIK